MLLFNLKSLGLFYISFSLFGGLIGFSLSVILRIELNSPFSVFGEYFYYVCLTSHAFVMVFYFLTTISTGLFYYFIDRFSNSTNLVDNPLPLFSLLLYLVSFLLLVISLLLGEGLNTGWTLYVPLSLSYINDSVAIDLAILSVIVFLLYSILNSVTIFTITSKIFSNHPSTLDVPVLVWSYLLTSILVLLSNPSLLCVLLMLLSDRFSSSYYFSSEFGGDPVLFQSIFWIWGHPEVYILILPIFGMVSNSLYVECNGYLYNRNGIIFSMVSLTLLSFLVWGHHMVTVGWDIDIKGFFMVSTVIISIPTGVKVFSWTYTLFFYGVRFNCLSLSLNLFIVNFVFGGITGVFLSNYSLDILYHDSYFVIGHFHNILASSSFFGLISGTVSLYFNSPIYNIKNNNLFNFSIILTSTSLTQLLFSMYLCGFVGVPRRVSNYLLEYYLIFYLGSVSTLGLIVSLYFFLLSFLLYLNSRIEYHPYPFIYIWIYPYPFVHCRLYPISVNVLIKKNNKSNLRKNKHKKLISKVSAVSPNKFTNSLTCYLGNIKALKNNSFSKFILKNPNTNLNKRVFPILHFCHLLCINLFTSKDFSNGFYENDNVKFNISPDHEREIVAYLLCFLNMFFNKFGLYFVGRNQPYHNTENFLKLKGLYRYERISKKEISKLRLYYVNQENAKFFLLLIYFSHHLLEFPKLYRTICEILYVTPKRNIFFVDIRIEDQGMKDFNYCHYGHNLNFQPGYYLIEHNRRNISFLKFSTSLKKSFHKDIQLLNNKRRLKVFISTFYKSDSSMLLQY